MTSPEDSPLFDGVVAALNGLRLLRSQPDVDKSRVGIFGGSWGGYMTTMIASLAGNRARASFSVYGCGYFDVGSAWTHRLKGLPPRARAIWLKHLDAGRRAKNLTAAHFVASPTNDWFFWPNAVMRTLADVPGEKNWCFMPNESHMLSLPGGMAGPPPVNHRENRTYMETVWMAHHLKGEGAPFHRVTATGQPVRHGREVEVRFRVHGAVGKTQAYVWWAAGELPWRTKWWEAAPTKPLGDGRFVSRFPIDEPSEPVNWFAAVADSRNVTCSTLIQTFEPTAVGFGNDDGSPPVFCQDFEQPGQHRRWRMKYADRRPGRHRVSSQAAHSGKHSLEIVPGQSAMICFGIRAATLRRGRATRLTLWVKAAKKPCPLPTVQLVAEQPDGDRLQWEWRPQRIPEAGTQWTQVAMPLSEFRFVGGKPPIPLLSPSLGLLQLTTKPDVHVFVDDVEAQ
ncbi:MAG: prolyl oligopeptidase family serine peptidase [Planctomycetes bacterium]|nr:prolyl oligopeptidase family serine peptidase [Planctomycetota bacterium]